MKKIKPCKQVNSPLDCIVCPLELSVQPVFNDDNIEEYIGEHQPNHFKKSQINLLILTLRRSADFRSCI